MAVRDWVDGDNPYQLVAESLGGAPARTAVTDSMPALHLLPLAGRDAPGGGFYTIWLSHSIFALPLAIYLMHNFMREIPGELIESARVDGAGHVQIFTRIMLPLLTPAIAAFGIFQFLWVWNDLLVALVFAGGNLDVSPLTVRLAALAGQRGEDWHLLSAGAFVSLIVPGAARRTATQSLPVSRRRPSVRPWPGRIRSGRPRSPGSPPCCC